MLDDVLVYGFERLAQRDEEVFGQASEEKATHKVDVTGGGFAYRPPAVAGQFDLGRPPVPGGKVAFDQAATLHSSGVMGQAAPLPTDLGRQSADLHTLVRYSAEGVKNVIVGQR